MSGGSNLCHWAAQVSSWIKCLLPTLSEENTQNPCFEKGHQLLHLCARMTARRPQQSRLNQVMNETCSIPHHAREADQTCFEICSKNMEFLHFFLAEPNDWVSSFLSCRHGVAKKGVWPPCENWGKNKICEDHWWPVVFPSVCFPNCCGSPQGKKQTNWRNPACAWHCCPLATEGCCSVACQWGNLDQSPKKNKTKLSERRTLT